MTVEEIKQSITMKDVLERYGVKVNRNNMCCCPIHGERHPSMKVFPDGFNCFACGANGDIFSFIQIKEECSFKEAFISLGGTYAKSPNKTKNKLINAKYDRKKKHREKEKDFENEFRKILDDAIYKCELVIWAFPPFSDNWCLAQTLKQRLEYAWDSKYLENEEINKADVIRNCKRIERIRFTV